MKTRIVVRRIRTGAAVLAVAMTATLGVRAEDRPLVVVSWGGAYQDAQKQVYFEPFRKASGLPIIDESWDGGTGVLRTRVQSGKAGWDVVQVDAEELTRGCDEELFVILDWTKIGGKEQYLPAAVTPCGAGAIVYSVVLAYDRDKIPAPPKSWADFFDTKTYPGKRALRMGPKTTLEIALIGDGVAPADVYKVLATPEGVDRAFQKLDGIKSDLVFWTAGAQPPQFLASGDVVMTSAYNGRIDAANRSDQRNLGIAWNGSLYTLDSWVILKDSPRMAEAYRFLDFAGAAENQARLPPIIAYGVTNKDANGKIDPKRLADLPTAPENMKNAEMISPAFWLENLDKLTDRFNKWAAAK